MNSLRAVLLSLSLGKTQTWRSEPDDVSNVLWIYYIYSYTLKNQSVGLLRSISTGTVHIWQCIKPNDTKHSYTKENNQEFSNTIKHPLDRTM